MQFSCESPIPYQDGQTKCGSILAGDWGSARCVRQCQPVAGGRREGSGGSRPLSTSGTFRSDQGGTHQPAFGQRRRAQGSGHAPGEDRGCADATAATVAAAAEGSAPGEDAVATAEDAAVAANDPDSAHSSFAAPSGCASRQTGGQSKIALGSSGIDGFTPPVCPRLRGGGNEDERERLECLRGIQQNGYRALVHQFHLHCFLEAAGFAAQAGGANLLHEEFVELARFFGRRGGVE